MKKDPDATPPQQNNLVVSLPATTEFTLRRSRFISYLFRVDTKQEAVTQLEALIAEHRDAVHHCYAYRLGEHGMEYRMSDDGEPSGTAGKPILFALQKNRITNSILVVVRYFGGVKLGVGPLARAYTDAAVQVIQAAKLVPIIPTVSLEIFCMYDDVSKVITLLEEVNATYAQTFEDAVTFNVTVATQSLDYLTAEIIERTNARAGFKLA